MAMRHEGERFAYIICRRSTAGTREARLFDRMYNGEVKAYSRSAMNAGDVGPNSQKNIDALKKGRLAGGVRHYPEETSDFGAPGSPKGMKKINTSVYRVPGAGFAKKDAHSSIQRAWLQWKNIAGDSRRKPRWTGDTCPHLLKYANSTPKGRQIPERFGLTWITSDPHNPPRPSRKNQRTTPSRCTDDARRRHQGRPTASRLSRF